MTIKDVEMPFGKHKGQSIHDIPSPYFRWLLDQDWFEQQYPEIMTEVEGLLEWRDKYKQHIYD